MNNEIRIEIVESPMQYASITPPLLHLDILQSLQKEVPWTKKEHFVAPWFLKCDGKIAKYDMSGLHIWRVIIASIL